jgi:hypothetical protein
LSARNRFAQVKKAARHRFFKSCCPNTTRASTVKTMQPMKRNAGMQRLPQRPAEHFLKDILSGGL